MQKKRAHYMYKALGILLTFLATFGTSWAASSTHPQLPPTLVNDNREALEAVEKQLSNMTIEEQVGQLIMPMIYPTSTPAAIDKISAMLNKIHAGGVLYQKGDAYVQYTMNRELNARSKYPLLISADNEWGLAMRLSGTIRYPRNMGLQHAPLSLIEKFGHDVALQCKTIGIQVSFAPVLDVNNNPKNPVIGTRSFSENKEEVARLGLAYAKAMEAQGVLSVAKHFPGHGNTNQDSHKTLPTIKGSRKSLFHTELYPFIQYINAGLGGIMMAHLKVPALDGSGKPASMSPLIATDLLQKELGFRGLIITDALMMEGALHLKGQPQAVQALLAGNDILLAPGKPEQTYQQILTAIQQGIISKQLIRERCQKVLLAKWHLFGNTLNPKELPHLSREAFFKRLNTPAICADADALWLASVYVPTHQQQLYNELQQGSCGVLNISSKPNDATGAIAGFNAALKQLNKQIPQYTLSSTQPTQQQIDQIERKFANCSVLYINLHQTATSNIISLLKKLQKRSAIIVTYYGSPFRMGKYEKAMRKGSLLINVVDNCPEAGRAAAIKFFAPNSGMPIVLAAQRKQSEKVATQVQRQAVPTVDNKKFAKVDEIAREGIEIGAYPGCEIAVIYKGDLVYNKAFGTLDGTKGSPKVTTSTLYDIASVTKALSTTPCIMKLVELGKVKVGDRVSKYLPQLAGTDIGRASIKQLLLHESGLPASINFYEDLVDAESLPEGRLLFYRGGPHRVQIGHRTWAANEFQFNEQYISPKQKKGFTQPFAKGAYIADNYYQHMLQSIGEARLKKSKHSRYSDVGFILLSEVVRAVTHMPIDQYFEKTFATPLSLQHCTYRPLESFTLQQIAPTQAKNFLRGKVWGNVDDESAACLGGSSGNAGLFANAFDAAKLGLMLLDAGRWQGNSILDGSIVKLFRTTRSRDGKRVMGYSSGYKDNPNLPEEASAQTFGHTGFTGTCIWIDPKKDLVFVFLSNRTYPTRLNNKLNSERIRPRLLEAVYKAL